MVFEYECEQQERKYISVTYDAVTELHNITKRNVNYFHDLSFFANAKILSFFAPILFGVFFVFRFILIFGNPFGRNGIVTSGTEGVATKDSSYRECHSHKKATFSKRLYGVG